MYQIRLALILCSFGSAAYSWESDIGDNIHALRWRGEVDSVFYRADNVGGDPKADIATEGGAEVLVQILCSKGETDYVWAQMSVEISGLDSISSSVFDFDAARDGRRTISLTTSYSREQSAVTPVEVFAQDSFSARFTDEVYEWRRSTETDVFFEEEGHIQYFGVLAMLSQIRNAVGSVRFYISSQPVELGESDLDLEAMSISFDVPAKGSTVAAKKVMDRCYGDE